MSSVEDEKQTSAVMTPYDSIAAAIEKGDYGSARRFLTQLDRDTLDDVQTQQVLLWEELLAPDRLAVVVLVCSVLSLIVIAYLMY